MASLTVETTRYIDSYKVQDKYGNNYTQAHMLSVVDANGILTDTIVKAENLTEAQKSAMVANGIEFDKYGNAYYVTENLSRFIHYGVDSSGTLYAFNYAGEKMNVNSEMPGSFLSEVKATYNLDWNNVSMNGLSLERVIMLVTLIRAELIEEQLVNQMDELAKRTALLNGSAGAEQLILDYYDITSYNDPNAIHNKTSFTYTDGSGTHTTTLKDYLTTVLEINIPASSFPADTVRIPLTTTDITNVWSKDFKDQVISAIQSKQDELNTISQETSINIQSLINKRDQSYLLGTNAISLFYSGHINVARNM